MENVAQNYTDIKEGKVRNRNKTYIIEVSDKYNNTLFVELSQDGSYWNVNSADVFRKKYSQGKKPFGLLPKCRISNRLLMILCGHKGIPIPILPQTELYPKWYMPKIAKNPQIYKKRIIKIAILSDIKTEREAIRAEQTAAQQEDDYWNNVKTLLNRQDVNTTEQITEEQPADANLSVAENETLQPRQTVEETTAAKQEEQQQYPTDEAGEPLWYEMTEKQFDVAMTELGDDADAFIADNIKEAQKAIKKAEKAKPKSSEFAKRKAEQQSISAEKATAQKAYDYWTAQQARRSENAQSENLEETNKKPIFTEKETSYERQNGLPQAEIEVSLSEQEASVFMEVMGANAVEQPIIELNSSNWIQQFGADGKVSTPLGEVKMGNNQIAKLFEKGRNEQFGMIKPTLETPLAVIEVPSEATEQKTERASSLLFVKTFLGKNGERVYYFKSVTVKKDGMEVSVSSHYDRPKRIKEALKNGKLLYRFDGGAQTEHRPADTSVAASRNEEQGLSDSKDSDIPSKKQNPGGNGLSPDDAGNRGAADTGG